MLGSNTPTDRHHRHDPRLMMEAADGDELPPPSGVSCSICLDVVSHNGGRSRAKLQCGHEFHLDCIGSAFNVKGAMQCPNCRKVEKGQWLYANGSARSLPDFSMEDWNPDEDYYDLSYPEMPFRVQWCPFGELTRISPSYEEVESPSTTYHELQGHHAAFAEHGAASSVAHSYVAYVGPVSPIISRSRESPDDPNFNHHWNNLSRHTDGPTATVRSSHRDPDALARPRSYPHPFPFEQGLGSRAGGSFVSAIFPRHPGSTGHTHERMQVSPNFHHQQLINRPGFAPAVVPGIRRGMPMLLPTLPQPDQNGGFYVFPPSGLSGQNPQEVESSLPNRYHAWESEHLSRFPTMPRDMGVGIYHSAGSTGGADSSSRSSSFWYRNLS